MIDNVPKAGTLSGYNRAHHHARKAIGRRCERCETAGDLHAALRPDAPAGRLLLDPETGCLYSTNVTDYFALCPPCHRQVDLVEGRPTCRRGHPYAADNTSLKPDGSRRCLTCHRQDEARRLQDPAARAVKAAADRAYRARVPMTPEQKARKIELQRLRRQRARM